MVAWKLAHGKIHWCSILYGSWNTVCILCISSGLKIYGSLLKWVRMACNEWQSRIFVFSILFFSYSLTPQLDSHSMNSQPSPCDFHENKGHHSSINTIPCYITQTFYYWMSTFKMFLYYLFLRAWEACFSRNCARALALAIRCSETRSACLWRAASRRVAQALGSLAPTVALELMLFAKLIHSE
jgi:hypothetical protein